MATTTSASATFSRQACTVGCPLAVKYSIMRRENPWFFAAFSACARYSLRSSEVEEMKTTVSRSGAITPQILAQKIVGSGERVAAPLTERMPTIGGLKG